MLSGQLNTLNKVLKHEKTPLLRNQVIIPLVLSPDRDEEIMVRNFPLSVGPGVSKAATSLLQFAVLCTLAFLSSECTEIKGYE